MVQAIRYFLEFCYHVRRDVLDDDDLDKLDELLAKFHEMREVFREVGVRPKGFNLPRQHALTHYRNLITEFGAPNGLCSSITESQHIDDIKDAYRRSNRNQPLSQMLTTNQRMDKLAAQHSNFAARGMLNDSLFQDYIEAPPHVASDIHTWSHRPHADDDDGGAVDGKDITGEVLMARTAGMSHLHIVFALLTEWPLVRSYKRNFIELVEDLNIPSLREDVSRYLYELDHPDLQIPLQDVPLEQCPSYIGKIYVFPSAIAIYHAPSNLSGIGGMFRERIRSTSSWRNGLERRDCIYVVHDQDQPGFRGLYVAQVKLFFKIKHHNIDYECAWVNWFSTIGNEPCPETGMWRVEPDFNENGQHETSVIHIDTILRAAHLIGIAGEDALPRTFNYNNSLDAFNEFYVNKFIDYHAHETIF